MNKFLINAMNTSQIIFLIINILGGILVLGSYYLGLKGNAGVQNLWGGTPKKIQPVYTVSMLISAIGYFLFFTYIIQSLGTGFFDGFSTLGDTIIYIAFVVILGASTFWMPLTKKMVETPSNILWIAIRIVLMLVALGSIGLLVVLVLTNNAQGGLLYITSVIGLGWFSFHTMVLDALLWPYFWKKK